MGVSLTKGANVNLSRTTPGLKSIRVGLGWDVRGTAGVAFDLDASAFLLTEFGDTFKVRSDADFVFYNNLASACGSVRHMGDNLTGVGDGDDEVIQIDLNRVPPDVVKIRICVTINEADSRHQNFGMVSSAFIRVVNNEDQSELARFDLSEDASVETAMVFGEIYLHNGEWKFKAVGQGFPGGLEELARYCGINV
jgi:tellurium resistance protein TerD